jgi:hypothetical protein
MEHQRAPFIAAPETLGLATQAAQMLFLSSRPFWLSEHSSICFRQSSLDGGAEITAEKEKIRTLERLQRTNSARRLHDVESARFLQNTESEQPLRVPSIQGGIAR